MMSALNRDGEIDVARLEREVTREISAYNRNRAEDEMKKKSIHNVKDYDEFRNFVSVSQLKPTSRREVASLFAGTPTVGRNVKSNHADDGIGGFEDSIQRRRNTTSDGDARVCLRVTGRTGRNNQPTSRDRHDFLREWNRQCKSPADTLRFLTRTTTDDRITAECSGAMCDLVLEPDRVCKDYFATDMDSEVLGHIIEALNLLRQSEQGNSVGLDLPPSLSAKDLIRSWTRALKGCGRFDLSLSFQTKDLQHTWGALLAYASHDRVTP
ncbi:hypothetical protein THAOC_09492 [Thalassiosira oceanica]|uniref:Dynein attachment factor N-terminal domain-containing protein n=1 Tax=Thalassiosira oceanica TaxID=159749 RepID=K0T7I5_THAOC|nr:hypothetical protein THAOC_09492 [Thalassiosira oceanica]|mmetsp:Transcript_30049/g.71507  ORF Transcript_30049/g.71507 Transcript_30049/m.71507 type:complete len:268 (-) Transcript_30049:123-926(-)|eukprot:EJK69271.1 hypothetical protein THAOC_09492 [Thalassiosira oceanica]